MDFHSLSRRELQALCKKNKIPANITNVAMADALQALHSGEGLEDVLMAKKTSLDSPAKTEIKQSVPHTSCRTSTRQKPVREEPQTTQISTRTRGGTRRAPAGQEPDNAAPVDVARHKMEIQLKEAAEDRKKGAETPATMAAVSRRKTGTTSVREAYSTRRTTRLLEKKLMGLNLDYVDYDQIVEGDKVVEELKSREESVIYKAMEFEGISQQKKSGNLQEMTDDNEEHSVKAELQQKSEVVHESVDDKDADAEVFDENKGISQQKQPSDLQEQTGISDEKHAAALEASLMSDNNEENSLKVELQQKSEFFDESVDDKDAETEVLDVNKGFLSSELTKMEPNIDGPTDSLVLENEEESLTAVKELEADSIDQLEIDQEAHKATDVISTSMVEEKSQKLENEESLGLNEFATDSINKGESEPEKSLIMMVAQISEEKCEGEIYIVNHEVHEGLSEHPTGLNQLPSEENMAFETGCGEKCDEAVAAAKMQDVISSEKFDQISSWPVISESKIVDNFEGKVGISIENSMVEEKSEDSEDFSPQQLENEESVGLNEFATDSINTDQSEPEKSTIMIAAQISEEKSEGELSSVSHEVHEDLSEHPTGLNQLPSEENMAFETGCREKCDQLVAVAEMQDVISSEKCDQIRSWSVISESKIVDNFEGKVGISFENSETIRSKATENINILSAINKENFVKEKVKKVKMATADMSIRQLKKMLKQLQITDKKADIIKEDENIAEMGMARPALHPLSDNCLASSKDEYGN